MDAASFWILGGMILLISEMLTGGFFLIFMALGFFGAGLAASFEFSSGLQVAVCAVIAVVGVFTLRKPIQKRLLKTITLNADVGKEIRVDQSIDPHKTMRISYQGTSWNATNLGDEALKSGDHVTIVGVDGNTLLIRKID